MTDRDRLIELMKQDTKDFTNPFAYEYGDDAVERFADHLISNGVILPIRCKDCKHFIPDEYLDHTKYPNKIEADGLCDNIDKYTDIDHFCYYGKLSEKALAERSEGK